MKRCATLLLIRDSKSTMTCHFMPTGMAILKKIENNCWGGYAEIITLAHSWWECK